MPDSPGLELIMAEINRSHPGAVIDTSFDREQPALLVSPDHLIEVLTWLKETPGQEYTFMSSLHGVDYFPATPRFAVHYELMNRERHERLRVKAIVPDPEAGGGAASVEGTGGRLSTAAAGAAAVSPGVPPVPPTESASTAPGEGSSAPSAPDREEDHPVTGSRGTDSAIAASAGGASGGTSGESSPETPGNVPEPATTVAAGVGGGSGGTRGENDSATAESFDSRPPEPSPAPATVVIDGQLLPVVPSCVHLYPTAEFQEREVFDFFGIVFDGHPDPRRILMPEDYVGWPQRRDFPVGGEPVIFTKDEVENPGWWK